MQNGFIQIQGVKLPKEAFQVKKDLIKIHGERIIPHVVEPSFGFERLLYVVLENAYTIRNGKVVMKIHKELAPYHVAVFPLVTGKKAEHLKIVEIARKIHRMLLERGFRSVYDEDGSIGRRYARADEIGIPYALTVDYQTLEDNTITLRDRDTTHQERIKTESVINLLFEKFKNFFLN